MTIRNFIAANALVLSSIPLALLLTSLNLRGSPHGLNLRSPEAYATFAMFLVGSFLALRGVQRKWFRR